MLQQIVDLQAEAGDLSRLLESLPETDWTRPTQFKGWTINDVVIHLHAGDLLAAASVKDAAAFAGMLADIRARRAGGLSGIEENRQRVGPRRPARPCCGAGARSSTNFAAMLAAKDPEARLKWAGPDMGVRMFTTARQMEVWAHGQEIYDILGQDRAPTDRLKSIAVIGVRTYRLDVRQSWIAVPGEPPHVRLTGPSGDIWEWNPPSHDNAVTGSALEFCQVVTQVRNIADTRLQVTGEPAPLDGDRAVLCRSARNAAGARQPASGARVTSLFVLIDADDARSPMPELKSEYLFTITVTVDAWHDFGAVPLGTRHVDMLGKGTFEGPRLKGSVLPGGMDMKTCARTGR